MTLFAIRTNSGSASLRDLQSLLQTSHREAQQAPNGQIYVEILLLALVLVNGSLFNRSYSASHEGLAQQAAAMALAVAASVRILISDQDPKPEEIAAQESQFIVALQPHIDSMKSSLTNALRHLTVSQGSPSFVSFLWVSTADPEADRISKELRKSHAAFSLKVSLFVDNQTLSSQKAADERDADGILLTWDQVDLRTSCQIPSAYYRFRLPGNLFWENAYHAVVGGSKVIVRTYPGESFKNFTGDLELMQKMRHSNLPSLFGYSKRTTSTPFIAISMKGFTPLFEYLPRLCEMSPESALTETWKMIVTMRSTVQYLVGADMIRVHLGLQELIRTAVVDNTGKIILTPYGVTLEYEYGITDRPLEAPLSASDLYEAFRVLYADYQGPARDMLILRPLGHPSFEYIDHLPRLLRPVRYLLESQAELPASSTRPEDEFSQLLNPKFWKAIPLEKRSIYWPIRFDSRHYVQPAVGDIGRFSRAADGDLVFICFENLQNELGGYLLEDLNDFWKHKVERISRHLWRLPYSHDYPIEFSPVIPAGIALAFLSANARRFCDKYGTSPTELLIVTRTETTISWNLHQTNFAASSNIEGCTISNAEDEDAFFFARFDDEGRILQLYQSNSRNPHEDVGDLATGLATLHSCLIEPGLPPQFVQCEEYELNTDSSVVQASDAEAKLGDIGCSVIGDGQIYFQVLSNGVADFLPVRLEPWERNDCEDIGKGVWRSRPINLTEESNMCFSWSVHLSPVDLPSSLQAFYLYFHASGGGKKVLPANDDLQLVTTLHRQVYATFCPQPNGLPLRLFFHFDTYGALVHVYWSTLDEQCNSLSETPRPPGCHVRLLPSKLSALEGEQLTLPGPQRYRKAGAPSKTRYPRGPHNNSAGCELGDVGYWVRESRDACDQWYHLGRIELPREALDPIYSSRLGYSPCHQMSENLWGTKDHRLSYHADYPSQREVLVSSEWTKIFPIESPRELQDLRDMLARNRGVPVDDIMIVTQVTTHAEASASTRGLVSNAPPPESHGSISNTSWPPADNEDYDNQYLRDLQFFVAFPRRDSPHGFWARESEGNRWLDAINCRALSGIDLEGWQMPGCTTRVFRDVQRTSILKLCSTNERDPSGALGHESMGSSTVLGLVQRFVAEDNNPQELDNAYHVVM